MKKVEFTKKRIIQAAVVGASGVLALLFCVSQKVGIGQNYQAVSVNGSFVGYTAEQVDVKSAFREARRELSLERGERFYMDVSVESGTERELFRNLLSERELKDAMRGVIDAETASSRERVYTVAIDGYRANFTSLDEVRTFLNRVKEPSDELGEYETTVYGNGSHVSGMLTAVLAAVDSDRRETAISETADTGGVSSGVTAQMASAMGYKDEGSLSSGVTAQMASVMGYAVANPPEARYQTGLLDMEFVEKVEVYENYVDASEISDLEEQILEVTKEKESNKIYVVESGDCLSVIALDHDTTVDAIVSLNALKNADAIREGQELIIAVPEPDLRIRLTVGEVYEEDYTADPVIMENDGWYTTKEVVHEEGSAGHRERNDVVVYENGMEMSRELVAQNVMVESQAAVIERGTIIPPTYIKPLSGGRFSSGFGPRWGRMHKGVDWACPVGTTVYASSGGTVIQASYNSGYGNNVVISHPDGRMTRYAHNSKLLVRVGQKVEQGEAVALSGNTGRSTGPHVHFELYVNGSAVNPLKYIGN
ncbi:MAG: peptidoglycan DD-metalloendopeptidase family protein [Roseburia sp.]